MAFASPLPCLNTLQGLTTLVQLLHQAFGLAGGEKKQGVRIHLATSSFLGKEKKKQFKEIVNSRKEGLRAGRESLHSCITEPCLLLFGFSSLNADKER